MIPQRWCIFFDIFCLYCFTNNYRTRPLISASSNFHKHAHNFVLKRVKDGSNRLGGQDLSNHVAPKGNYYKRDNLLLVQNNKKILPYQKSIKSLDLPVAHEEGEIGFYRDTGQDDAPMCVAVCQHLGHQHMRARQVLWGATTLAQAAMRHLKGNQCSVTLDMCLRLCATGAKAMQLCLEEAGSAYANAWVLQMRSDQHTFRGTGTAHARKVTKHQLQLCKCIQHLQTIKHVSITAAKGTCMTATA